MLGIVRRFFDCGPIVANELISGPLDFGRQLGLMYAYFVWVVGSTSYDVPVFNGFPSRHFISHSAEQGQWNQIDPLDQDAVVSGMVGEEGARNFMVGFGKAMNEMEWHVVFYGWTLSPELNHAICWRKDILNLRDVHSRKLTWQWRLQRRMNHL